MESFACKGELGPAGSGEQEIGEKVERKGKTGAGRRNVNEPEYPFLFNS
jgi:hypothetical protein